MTSGNTQRFSFGRLILTGLAVLLALGCLYCRTLYFPSNGLTEVAEYLFIIFASIAVIAFLPIINNRINLKRVLAMRGLVYLSAAVLFCLVMKYGMYQFGGYDESGIVHAAAYYDQGLRPMVDFPSALPPLFLAGIRLALICFGMRWLSFALFAAAFASATLLWLYSLLRLASFPAHWAFVLALTFEGATMFVVPIWWYNNVTSLVTVLLLLSVLACLRAPGTSASLMSMTIALAMVITAKPNAAPACLVVLVVFATRKRSHLIKAGLACCGALALAMVVCLFAQTQPSLLWAWYREAAKLRGNPFLFYPFKLMDPVKRIFESSFALFFSLCAGDLLMRALRQRTPSWRINFACGVIFVSALLLVLTNAEVEITSLVGMFAGCAVLCVGPGKIEAKRIHTRNLLVSLTVIFAVTEGLLGFTHTRIRTIGERMFYEPYSTQMIHTGFFRGLEAGPRLQRVLAQTQEALERYPSHTVFFGPRMEFEYAVFHRSVMYGMPLFWDSEGNFSPKRFPRMITDIRAQNPDILIFLKDDYTRMGTVADYIRSASIYERLDSFEDLTVYVKKRGNSVVARR